MEELAEAGSLIENAAKSSRYWPPPRQIPTSTWNQYRTDIAAAIDSPLDWRLITSAYDTVNNLNWTVQHRRNTTTAVDDHRLGVEVSRTTPVRRGEPSRERSKLLSKLSVCRDPISRRARAHERRATVLAVP
jgi:hypothetical protein